MNEALKLSQIRALAAVAEHGNFSEAAFHLGLSQSAISHAIASLEEELGVSLVSRGRHGAVLTPVGERILAHARQVLALVKAMVQEAQRERGLRGGRLRLGSFRSIATHILPLVIARFQARYAEVTISLTEYDWQETIEQDLREGRIDIGLTHLPTPEGLSFWELARDEYVVLFPPESKIAHPLRWQDLAQQSLILPADGSACGERIRHHLRTYEPSLRATYEVKEDSTIVSMVAQGLGVAILPRLAAEPIPPGVQIRSLPNRLERVLGVAVLASALHPPAVHAFLDALLGRGLFATLPDATRGGG